MFSLKEYRDKAVRLADYLPWAFMVDPSVVLNKDGCFMSVSRGQKQNCTSFIRTANRRNSSARSSIVWNQATKHVVAK